MLNILSLLLLFQVESALQGVKDFTRPDENESGYKYLVDYLTNNPSINAQYGNLSYKDAISNPARLRGKFVKVIGLVARITPIRFTDEQFIYRLYLVDTSGDEGFICDVLTKPALKSSEDAGLAYADISEVQGIFYKVAEFLSKRNIQAKVPFIVGKVAKRVDTSTAKKQMSPYGILAVGVGLLCILVLSFVILWRHNRHKIFNLISKTRR
jgi:hypothetical protein